MGGRCGHCGAPALTFRPAGALPGVPAPRAAVPGAGPVGAAAWLPAAEQAGAGGDLGAILRGYRRACALTQQQLADMLGYDRTYISMIESGRRHLTDRGTLAHIAAHAGHPAARARDRRPGRRRLRRHARVRYLGHPAGSRSPGKAAGPLTRSASCGR